MPTPIDSGSGNEKRVFKTFPLTTPHPGYAQFIQWAASRNKHVAFLSSSGIHTDPYSETDAILATGIREQICVPETSAAFEVLKEFTTLQQDWIFGFLSYDLKNQLEDLTSSHADGVEMPLMHFFVPQHLFIFRNNRVEIGMVGTDDQEPDHETLFSEVLSYSPPSPRHKGVTVQHNVKRDEYINTVKKIKEHIQKGDIYEANYCIEFYAEDAVIDPVETFLNLNRNNPAPFSCFYRYEDKYLLSSSPERFLAKRDNMLISQPIKGTIRRGSNAKEDQALKQQLANDPKERSENVMIVDLVRNDLSKTAMDGSVAVRELCGIYSYTYVHQMISTITSSLREDIHFIDAIKECFPMGSMTGAPKIRAMQIIEECESTRRGLYSGAVGYITPRHDFDFNVIIRSILYNQDRQYLSFMAGSAITIASEPEKEYNECLLKATSMAKTLHSAL